MEPSHTRLIPSNARPQGLPTSPPSIWTTTSSGRYLFAVFRYLPRKGRGVYAKCAQAAAVLGCYDTSRTREVRTSQQNRQLVLVTAMAVNASTDRSGKIETVTFFTTRRAMLTEDGERDYFMWAELRWPTDLTVFRANRPDVHSGHVGYTSHEELAQGETVTLTSRRRRPLRPGTGCHSGPP